jgi:hypothetical protein
MTHDPLCPDGRADHNKPPVSQCGWCEFSARVREDERARIFALSERVKDSQYAAALGDAVEAVALVETYMDFPFESPSLAMSGETGVWLVREQALAAIKALGGER